LGEMLPSPLGQSSSLGEMLPSPLGRPIVLDSMKPVQSKITEKDFAKIVEIFKKNTGFESVNTSRYIGLFPISTGCNNFCSYCIVPFTRGGLRHKETEEILEEITRFVRGGGKIVTLVGQNVNSWQGRLGAEKMDFAKLLLAVCKIPGDFWVNFVSSNPMDFSSEMIKLLATEPKLMKSVNLAVQSGSDKVLKAMNRRYTIAVFTKIALALKKIENFRLTTDIIVGFPGETESDFQKTLALIDKIRFDMVYVGKYSPRKGTLSGEWVDAISKATKITREKKLKTLVNEIRLENNSKWEGQVLEVLVTGGKRGLSYYNHEVNFSDVVDESMVGEFVKCKVLGSSVKGLVVLPKIRIIK